MKKVGLTGNIGSGKSLVAQIFSTLGIPIYHADQASKCFLEDPGIVHRIREEFGSGILNRNNEVDRKFLAGKVFSNPDSLQKLNSILHPLVREDFRNWITFHQNHPYIILEAAIIFETGFQSELDVVIHISCPQEMAIRRVIDRDGVTREEVLKRMQFQMEDKKKAALSDFVIRNDGLSMLIPQVVEVHRLLSERCP